MMLCFEKICRTCMVESVTMLSICNNSMDTETSIIGFLKSFTTVAPQKNDRLPQNICLTCLSEVNRAISFKQKCERSEQTLQMYLQQSSQNPESSPVELTASDNQLSDPSSPLNLPDLGEITGYLKSESQPERELSLLYNNTELSQCNMIMTKENEFISDEESNEITCIDANPDILYQCPICGSTFQYPDELEQHVIDVHDEHEDRHESVQQMLNVTSDYIQYDSDIGSDSRQGYEIENPKNIKQPTSKKLICPLCDTEFMQKKLFQKHLIKYHSDDVTNREDEDFIAIYQEVDKQVSATACNSTTVSQISEIKNTFKCIKCGASFVKEKSLNIHQKSNKCTEKAFLCHICNRVFVRKRNLSAHMKTHADVKEFNCAKCEKQFTRKDQLIVHMSNHGAPRKHQCQYCSKGFNMISTLKDHIRTHNGERPYLCSICGRGFSQSTNLKQHVMRHNKTKPYQCKECTYAFVSKGELDAHLRKHTGDHPFVCDICGTGFTTSSSLVKHKRIHTGERPYACEFCPMRFTALGTLKNHRRTHTGERPFACNMCERRFAQRSDCVSHQKTHAGGRTFTCTHCNKSFSQNSALKVHLKSHAKSDVTVAPASTETLSTADTNLDDIIILS